MAFADVPKDYVLGATAETTSSVEEGQCGHEGHGGLPPPKDGHAH